MIRPALASATALLLAAPAASQQPPSMWSYHYQMGIGEYITGEWDSPRSAALNISCLKDGGVSIMPQIKGQAPPGGSAISLTASSREGSRESRFSTNAQGSVEIPAGLSPGFRQLWANLRWGDIVTLRYADGRTSVLSLDGAARTLPAKPCAD